MGFTTACIIRHKYDEEFLKKLKNIGYNISDLDGDELNCSYMLSMPIYSYIDFGWSEGFFRDIIYNGAIDCGTNENLFLAIAALRDDSDINQWFTDGKEWWLNKTEEYPKVECNNGWHKSTVEELIEHFK